MIAAAEALRLPTAKLSDEQKAGADELEKKIENHVRLGMTRSGVELEVSCTDAAVVADVNQRLRTAGWSTEWRPLTKQHPINRAVVQHIGFRLSLFPSDASYAEADKLILH